MERGLANKIQRVQHNRERRLRKRIHTSAESGGSLTATLPDGRVIELGAIDISIVGARARGPVALCGTLCIYQELVLKVCADEFCLQLPSTLIRTEHDPSGDGGAETGPGKSVVLAFRFDAMDEATLGQLREVLETLRSRYPD